MADGVNVMTSGLRIVRPEIVTPIRCPERDRCASAFLAREHLHTCGLWGSWQFSVLISRHAFRRGDCSSRCPLLDLRGTS